MKGQSSYVPPPYISLGQSDSEAENLNSNEDRPDHCHVSDGPIQWSSGICACCDDMQSCCIGLFCPCFLFGKNAEFLGSGTLIGSCMTHFVLWALANTVCCLLTEGILLFGEFVWLHGSMKNGSIANNSIMKLPTHAGTHVDAPSHMIDRYLDAGFDVDTLDLEVLNGPALLVDVPRDVNITAEVMKSLNIPKGVRRVLFRTLNTDRKLMLKKEFDTSYVGFMKDGAQWLVDNTDIKLVGVDYLSVAAFDDLIPAHLVFLEGREIILVEGLKLDDVLPGIYDVHCLPLRLLGAEGSPIRCILIK